ncbi:MAG: DUF1415 domain-containing protein [Gammaproteobacteria bacterium]|nr:DUF1415 domain-containing protein [Gammaproteobacteria bacterium]
MQYNGPNQYACDGNLLVDAQKVEQETRQWLQQVVVGLNLCPFAHRPLQDNTIRIHVTDCQDEETLLQVLFDEILLLQETPGEALETTLLVLTDVLQSFDEFNQFLNLSDQLLVDRGWQGVFQIASFHPEYCFHGVSADSDENLTNRSPWPVLHIIREESLERAVARYPDPHLIPQRNIERVSALTPDEKRALFPYLFCH